ncbi:multidrug efflux RND transporter permease subunit [Bartonella sp. HY329]|uniref:multidrug efflux RND transporter permease subunit n=1 Tax=unclassified Bartonella TaxID=2645622 RepID=UPI0021C96C18|nr:MULTISPECIES: multidrug efflux RND transporter permease subunit [unclassified Bartonella]UXM94657.1 multidrug efflux RND transporter permease subunit [Bartonella sp. HY329]UXN08980.1 multidrug efflux RND transporter permease subunit [Bartonella sp. HY328]
MAQFFIRRPIFAFVIAIFITLAGIIALPYLPVMQYPKIAPPQLTIRTAYPGASPQEIYASVTRQIEEELNGVENIAYFQSSTDSNGGLEITATFNTGSDIAKAQVDVQNKIRSVEPRLPRSVVDQGIQVEEAGTGFMMFVSLISPDGSYDDVALADYMSRNVLGELRRIEGVGRVQLFGSERALRIWLDPDRMVGLNLSVDDVTAAIRAQNAQVAAGRVGADPNPLTQELTATVLVKGQLTTPEEFASIILRANPDGSTVRLSDVARVELGAEGYDFTTKLDGQPSAAAAIQLSNSGNALGTSKLIHAKMAELASFFPKGVSYIIPYDTTPFVSASIEKVFHTLIEAVILVFLVMFLFLQNFRYTLIPIIVVPVALLGTCAIMLAAGFSINVLTMFAMVLAIGILVDDAIVVVENVERIMAEEGLPPKQATQKAMHQITGAIIGITLVLSAVFVPMAFFPGATGVIYRQFSLTMVVSILFSALLALTLTPALCATFLKPIPKGHHEKRGFFGWFNRKFNSLTNSYRGGVAFALSKSRRVMVVYIAIVVGLGFAYMRLPTGFVPNEDQGYIVVSTLLPPEASSNRTNEILSKIDKTLQSNDAVEHVIAVRGFSFFGSGPNAGIIFVTLKDWSERKSGQSAQDVVDWTNGQLAPLSDVFLAMAVLPGAIEGFEASDGFNFRLQDRGGSEKVPLNAAMGQLLAMANQSPILTGVYPQGLPESAQVHLEIDREKANAFGVTFADINTAITANLGSSYVNDFPNVGRLQRVVVQALDTKRLDAQQLLNIHVKNTHGGMVPLSAFAHIDWKKGPAQVIGYNAYPSVRISGFPAPGYTTGAAIAEMERIAKLLPEGFGFEWTGQTAEEIKSGSQSTLLFALSILFVFLLLAALYESWSIPVSVMLVVPLGIIGCVLAVMMRDMANDLYFKIGLITIIGLSAKNAILIVEFARELYGQGLTLKDAALEAAKLRFRPILMTSLAFSLGVLPLAIANGPGAGSQNAIGTGVLGGMITATVLAVMFVPVFFLIILRFFKVKPQILDDKEVV